MYIDAVKKEYAKTSIESERMSIDMFTLHEFFKRDKKEENFIYAQRRKT
jgi:hypothetical protein